MSPDNTPVLAVTICCSSLRHAVSLHNALWRNLHSFSVMVVVGDVHLGRNRVSHKHFRGVPDRIHGWHPQQFLCRGAAQALVVRYTAMQTEERGTPPNYHKQFNFGLPALPQKETSLVKQQAHPSPPLTVFVVKANRQHGLGQ